MTAPVTEEPARREKIAMAAAPVVQQEGGRPGSYLIHFMMPADLTAESMEAPTEARVRTREIPLQLAAADRFSGR